MENKISKNKNLLLNLNDSINSNPELNYLINHFCGQVVNNLNEVEFDKFNKIYICGDLCKLENKLDSFYIIKELSINYEQYEESKIVDLGKVPVLISNIGVYYRNLFKEENYFDKIKSEHVLQNLTESNKQSMALRSGIYLTEIQKEITENNNEILHFRLLRCSSNLTGPTDNYRETDHYIVNLLNESARDIFELESKLNHVLVQVYENKKNLENSKEVKSKIKAHSDKTKDMPNNGIMAFCTFYDNSNFEQLKPSESDKYDYCYKQTSALTRLHFKLKNSVQDDSLVKEFSVTLYPNSAFFIPLSTNRLYTHEIKPSILNIDKIPTRMGYVVRCSNLEALHMNNQTYIKESNNLIKLEEITEENIENLRSSYYEENVSEKTIQYGKIHFSMNLGDYEKPIF